MQIREMQIGKMLEILVDREGYHYRFVSKVEGTAEKAVAVSLIAAQGRAFHFEETDDISIIYRGGERMWKWEHVRAGMARLDGSAVHTFSSKEEGKIYNRRDAFRVPIGESLLMRRIIQEEDETGELVETEKSFKAVLSDLSVSGAGLYANEDMDVGTIIEFDMPTSMGILNCRGEIVRKTDVYDKPFQKFFGCDFTMTKKELERYLFERQRLMLQKERGGEGFRLKGK
ncbi:MAG: PilZ domain-containing protein [Lachnospiraceae bacterium]|nr:PilZ domain-containing protein [Lachnospiraceae bacterium]